MKQHILLWVIVFAALAAGIGTVWFLVQNGSLPQTTKPQTASVVAALNAEDHIMGPEFASVTLIEYSDFQCPACAVYAPLLKQLKNEFGESVAFSYRHFPLPQHANADLAARAAEAAGNQGKFWEMHDILFSNQNSWSEVKDAEEIFSAYASSLGLDLQKFGSDLDSAKAINKVADDLQSGRNANLKGTPTFFLNGKEIENPRSYEEFASLIKAAIEESE